jgi:protocatechuate 3,4-dioxygenase beta subunit
MTTKHALTAALIVVACALLATPACADEPAVPANSSWKVELTKEPTPPDGPSISVVGTILSPDGKPVPGASVVLRAKVGGTQYVTGVAHNRDILARTKTSPDGRFIFRRIAIPLRMVDTIEKLKAREEGAEIVAWSDDFGLAWTDVRGLDGNPDARLPLAPKADFRGTATDSDGKPLAHATIRVAGITKAETSYDPSLRQPGDLNLLLSEVALCSETDDQGRFSLDHLPRDHRIVASAQRPGYKFHSFVVNTAAATAAGEIPAVMDGSTFERTRLVHSPANLRLERAQYVEVKVLDHDGKPIEHAAVTGTSSVGFETLVDTMGTAWLELRKEGPHRFLAAFDPLEPRINVWVSTEIPADKPLTQVEIKVPEGRWLTGRVTDSETGRPVAGAYLNYNKKAEGDDWPNWSCAVSTADGSFHLPVLPGSGRLSFRDRLYGYYVPMNEPGDRDESRSTAVDIPATGDIQPVILKLARGLVISGTVRDSAGKPVASADIHYQTDRSHFSTRTDDQGHYELTGIPPRNAVDLTIASSLGGTKESVPAAPDHPWDKTRHVTLDVTLQTGITLSGRVLKDDKPQQGIKATIHRSTKEQPNRYNVFATVTTNADGRFSIGGLEAGDGYYFEIAAPDGSYDPTWRYQGGFVNKIPANAKPTIELPDLKLVTTNQTLRGTVFDPAGRPLSQISVSAMLALPKGRTDMISNPGRGRGNRTWTETDAQGRFELAGLPDRPIELMVYKANPAGGAIVRPAKFRPETNQHDIRITYDPSLNEEIEDLDAPKRSK